MSGSYWEDVRATGLSLPSDRPLDDLTAELTRMLGDPDPEVRDQIAAPALATWIGRGVYDDLLPGLGDGMAAGLTIGLAVGPAQPEDDAVFRRSRSALILGACIARDNERPLVPGGKVLEWGDRIATWMLRERDLRGHVAEKGWAGAISHGADALAVLAASPHVATPELTVILDVVADRVLAAVAAPYAHREADRLANTTLAVLRRDQIPLSLVEPWINRIAGGCTDPAPDAGNAEAFLRALYLQLALGPRPPEVRADLLLTLVDVLRRRNPELRRR